MRNRFLIIFFVSILSLGSLSLGGCVPKVDPATGEISLGGKVDIGIVAVERSFTLSMQVAKLYTDLPRCGKGSRICSDPKIVLRIRNEAIRVHDLILRARGNQNLITSAAEAVKAFSFLIPK
jgi:hypothetical protein